jgi:hypothetical protein
LEVAKLMDMQEMKIDTVALSGKDGLREKSEVFAKY